MHRFPFCPPRARVSRATWNKTPIIAPTRHSLGLKSNCSRRAAALFPLAAVPAEAADKTPDAASLVAQCLAGAAFVSRNIQRETKMSEIVEMTKPLLFFELGRQAERATVQPHFGGRELPDVSPLERR